MAGKKRAQHTYSELSDEQIRQAYADALRTVEHAHLQASIQHDLEAGKPDSNDEQLKVWTEQLDSYLQSMADLKAKLDALKANG